MGSNYRRRVLSLLKSMLRVMGLLVAAFTNSRSYLPPGVHEPNGHGVAVVVNRLIADWYYHFGHHNSNGNDVCLKGRARA